MTASSDLVHATAVRHADKAILLTGRSGSGKSSLALQLMAAGAGLIADDKVILTGGLDGVMAACPPQIAGMIEARGVGILSCPPADPAPVALVVDMDQAETVRMPPHRTVTLLGHNFPLLWHVCSPHFPATLLQLIRYGRSTR